MIAVIARFNLKGKGCTMFFLCDICNRRFTYKELLKSQRASRVMKCPKCSQKYTLTNSSRLLVAILIALPGFFTKILIEYIGWYILVFYLLWCCIVWIIMPIFYKYKKIN